LHKTPDRRCLLPPTSCSLQIEISVSKIAHARIGLLEFDRVQLSECQQQLAGAFTEHADLLAELPGNFDNMLSDIVFASDALVVFIPGLDPQRWNDSQDD
jgi:hypothetical protein